MKTKRILALALAGAMVMSMVACGGNSDSSNVTNNSGTSTADASGDSGNVSSTPSVVTPNQDPANTEKSDEELVVGLVSEPSAIYGSAVAVSENEAEIISHAIFDSLVKYDYDTKEIKPNLAKSWEWVDDTHLKFTLRDDVTMSDGTPLVADDVVYTCNEIWIAQNQSNNTGQYLVGATADDEHTVTIEFNTVAPDFLIMLSWTGFGIVSEDEVNAIGGLEAASKNPTLGTGPYKFKEWKNGQYVILERNEDYWNKDYAGYFKTIKFVFTSDAAAREMAVESGDADVAYGIPANQAATYASNDAVNTAIYTFGQTTHLWYNMGDNAGATKDIKVRQAIDKALNFDAIAQVGTAGFESAALSYWNPTCDFYQENYTDEERAVDIEGAKALLAEAGYENGLEIKALGLSEITPVLTVMQANLAEAGITLTLDTPDTAQFVEGAFGGDYDIICVGDAPNIRIPANVMPFLTNTNVYGPGMVIGGPKWTNDEFDTTIKELITATDNDKATEIATKLDEMVKHEMICSNLYPEATGAVYAKNLKGYNIIERGYVDVTGFYK